MIFECNYDSHWRPEKRPVKYVLGRRQAEETEVDFTSETERKGYQWPASALTCREMAIL